MAEAVPVTVAYGDGIGPEIMEATLSILRESGAKLDIETIEVGESVYRRGYSSGIEHSAWDSLRRTKVFLKAPVTTPQGGGFNSLNVTIRKALGLYANIRPCVSYYPFIQTKHPVMDIVIVRENEEDLYAGIEYRISDEVYQCLKVVSRPACEKIIRYAFLYARQNNRKKVTCFSKDNIMKMTDGLFHKTFDVIASECSDIQSDHWIVDIGAAKVAATPEDFDVIVTSNLYGDILSDVAAQIAGSVGLGGSANVGGQCAMFEAIHGSAPSIAGKDIANPSGLLLSAIMMLVHIGEGHAAERVHNAWLKTIEEGVHTPDIFREKISRRKAGTKEFAGAVVSRLGERPEKLKAVTYSKDAATERLAPYVRSFRPEPAEAVGVDVYVQFDPDGVERLAKIVRECETPALKLALITNRGIKVWPEGMAETFCTDSWRCRYMGSEGKSVSKKEILDLLGRLENTGVDFVQIEQLTNFSGKPGYSLGQGE